jgi:hypothetical protein
MKPRAVSMELLDELVRDTTTGQAEDTAVKINREKPRSSENGKLDVFAYLDHHGVSIRNTKDHGGSTLHVLKQCVFDSSHSNGESSIGQTADGKLFYQCFHDSCKGRTWRDARKIISGEDGLGRFMPGNVQPLDGEINAESEPPRPLLRQLPEPEPFPVHDLGPLLSAVAERLNHSIQAPLALCAQSGLAAVCLAVQGHANVVLDGRVIPLCCYFLTVGESGERKSAVDSEVLRTIRAFEKTLVDKHERSRLDYTNADEAYRKAKDEALKKAKGYAERKQALDKLGPPPDPPLVPMLMPQEPTFEGLFRLLAIGHPSVGISSDEAGALIGGHAMNADNRLKTAAGLSALWDGKPVTRVRAGDGAQILYGRRVSMHLMAQPNVSALFLGDSLLIEQGLVSRFLVSWPKSTAGTRLYRAINLRNDSILSSYENRMHDILNQELPVNPLSKQELVPRELPLSDDAKEIWREFHDLTETQLADGGPLATIRGFANKAAEHAIRLAGVLTLFEDLNAKEITIEKMEAGIHLAEYYLSEGLRLFHAGSLDPQLVMAEILLKWVQHYQYVHLAQIYQYGPNCVRDAKTARALAGILESHGWLKKVEGGKEIDGTKRKEVWEVWSGGHV